MVEVYRARGMYSLRDKPLKNQKSLNRKVVYQDMHNMTKKTPLFFYIAIILLYLVLFSTHLTSGLYARYTSASSAKDSARVAKFDVTSKGENGIALNINLDFFDPAKQHDSIEFEVMSSSEVAVEYDVVLVLPEEMMELVSNGTIIIKMDVDVIGVVDDTYNTITFEGGSFLPGTSQSAMHNITIEIKPGTMLVGTVNISSPATLRIHAEQID